MAAVNDLVVTDPAVTDGGVTDFLAPCVALSGMASPATSRMLAARRG